MLPGRPFCLSSEHKQISTATDVVKTESELIREREDPTESDERKGIRL